MQDQVEARAGLNGAGAGHDFVPMLDAETAAVPQPARPGRRSPIWAIMADEAKREELRRRVMETTESYTAIAKHYGTSTQTLGRAIAPYGWPRPPPAPKRADGSPIGGKRLASEIADAGMVKARLLRAVDRQIDKVDGRLRKKGAEVEEKDSRILGNLAKTLSALMQIGEGGTTSKYAEPSNSADAEQGLADRIKRWARGEQGY